MLTEMRQISNLRSQDVSKEILSDLVRKNFAEFSAKLSIPVCNSGNFEGGIT